MSARPDHKHGSHCGSSPRARLNHETTSLICQEVSNPLDFFQLPSQVLEKVESLTDVMQGEDKAVDPEAWLADRLFDED